MICLIDIHDAAVVDCGWSLALGVCSLEEREARPFTVDVCAGPCSMLPPSPTFNLLTLDESISTILTKIAG